MKKIGISISEQSLTFLDKVTDNRSAYIDNLIETHRKAAFQKELEQQYADLDKDPVHQTESADWDCTTGDFLDGE